MSISRRPFLSLCLLVLIGGVACASISVLPTKTPSVNPHVEISANTTTLKVGELVTVTGEVVDIGLPYFMIALKDNGAAEFAQLAEVTYENEIKSSADVSQVLELVSAEGDYDRVVVILRAQAAGATEITIGATGEVHSSGGAMWSGGSSQSLTITVASP